MTPVPKQQYPYHYPAIRPYIGPHGDSSILFLFHPKKDALWINVLVHMDQNAVSTNNPMQHPHIATHIDLKVNTIT